MSGTLWAAASGVGFGLFQALNGRAVRDLDSVYVSTFLQLVIAAVVLAIASLTTEDVGVLAHAPAYALLAFAGAGMIHFFLGWTLLNLSQERIGAARTSPLLSTTPLFGLVIAAVIVAQTPGWVALIGIVLTMAGAYVISDPGGARAMRPRDSVYGLGTACAWALSAVLTLEGLEGLDSPLLGVTLGMTAAALAYAAALAVSPVPLRLGGGAADVIAIRFLAGVTVAIATWGRWLALDDAAVAVVLALNLLSVPVVLLLAPVISGRHVEVVTPKLWAGATLVMVGSLLLIVRD